MVEEAVVDFVVEDVSVEDVVEVVCVAEAVVETVVLLPELFTRPLASPNPKPPPGSRQQGRLS